MSLLESVGHVHEADESLMDAVTGLSGSDPGGTTLAGLAVLESRGLTQAIIDAVVAATNRAAELGRG